MCRDEVEQKCADITYKQCQQELVTVCEPLEVAVPDQEVSQEQWCLFDSPEPAANPPPTETPPPKNSKGEESSDDETTPATESTESPRFSNLR